MLRLLRARMFPITATSLFRRRRLLCALLCHPSRQRNDRLRVPLRCVRRILCRCYHLRRRRLRVRRRRVRVLGAFCLLPRFPMRSGMTSGDGLARLVLIPNLDGSRVGRRRKKRDRRDGRERSKEGEMRGEDDHVELCVSTRSGLYARRVVCRR